MILQKQLSNCSFFVNNYLVYLFWSMQGLPEWNQPVRSQLLHILLSISEYLLHDNPAIEGNLPNLKMISMLTKYINILTRKIVDFKIVLLIWFYICSGSPGRSRSESVVRCLWLYIRNKTRQKQQLSPRHKVRKSPNAESL